MVSCQTLGSVNNDAAERFYGGPGGTTPEALATKLDT
jgi:hypothetical protein